MSNPDLPPELLDHVVDLLQDTRDALKNCCLIAKSWIPRSRRHLFARVAFPNPASLRSWRSAFPDPSTSPACCARSLFIGYAPVVVAEDAEEGGWIPTFSRVVHFELVIPSIRPDVDPNLSLIPFHGFSLALRFLRVASAADFPFPPIFNLIRSFSCLQDLAVVTHNQSLRPGDRLYERIFGIKPSNPSALTGVLKLSLKMGMNPIASRLLALPNSLHFRELRFAWNHEEDIILTAALVERCSPTLEILKIKCKLTGWFKCPIDLSRAVKFKEAIFVCRRDPRWITTTLRTLTSDHTNLRQISLRTSVLYELPSRRAEPADLRSAIQEAIYQDWLELDRLLTHLQESHSLRPKVMYNVPIRVYEQSTRNCMKSLFPEGTTRGIVDLVECGPKWK